jgi:hypothetical protein
MSHFNSKRAIYRADLSDLADIYRCKLLLDALYYFIKTINFFDYVMYMTIDGRCGVVVIILAYYTFRRSRVRFPQSAYICVHELSVCIGSGCFYV